MKRYASDPTPTTPAAESAPTKLWLAPDAHAVARLEAEQCPRAVALAFVGSVHAGEQIGAGFSARQTDQHPDATGGGERVLHPLRRPPRRRRGRQRLPDRARHHWHRGGTQPRHRARRGPHRRPPRGSRLPARRPTARRRHRHRRDRLPPGGPESPSKGSVSGLGRGIDVEGHRLHQLIQTDASINPGNSGGPLLTVEGTVVGLVEAKRNDASNIGYAIPADLAAGQFQTWREAPRPVHWVYSCSAPTRPDGVPVDITDRSGHPDGAAIGHAFATYVNGIDSGDYASAYAVLSPRDQQRVSYRGFTRGTVSSFIVDLSIGRITSAPGGDKVEVRFTSVQDPAYGVHGQDCSNWRLTYTMVQSAGRWLIDAAIPHPGSPSAC